MAGGGTNDLLPKPGTAEVQHCGDEGFPWRVVLFRADGSLREVARFLERQEADRACQHLRDAVLTDEEWVRKLIDVSSGELRG